VLFKEQLKNVPWYKGIDPLESRNPDRGAWIGGETARSTTSNGRVSKSSKGLS